MITTEVKQRPILFSTPMIQAILEGRKTQTRRIVKSRHKSGLFQVCRKLDGTITNIESLDWDERNIEKDIFCPYGKPGDILWVRESWAWIEGPLGSGVYIFKADGNCTKWIDPWDNIKWKPSIHMPKEACRLFLEITSIKVERLMDISEEDACEEGVEGGDTWKDYLMKDPTDNVFRFIEPSESFKSLWQSINGLDSWQANPFVWVIEFKRIEL